jgi:lysophospholipase L1-like esterase
VKRCLCGQIQRLSALCVFVYGCRTPSTHPIATSSTSAPGIRWVGRADTSVATAGALGRFAWSASGFVASVSGSTISVQLQTEGATTSAFFMPVVDGTPGARFQVTTGAPQTVVLATGLAVGPHAVELYRESEGAFGDDVFLGFAAGTLGPPPAGSGRLIEIVGDSISAGYGNLGSEKHPPYTSACTFSLATESAYASYGAVLARTLGAEVSIVARSGWGMYRDYGANTSNVVPSVYRHALGIEAAPAWSFSRKADAVVVNLGTNDSAAGDPGQPYEAAYVAFLHTVRGEYPAAWIFLTIGPMTVDPMLTTMRTHLANVVSTMADAKTMKIDLPPQDASSTGCDFHPNVAQDQAMAAALAPTLKTKLGW